MSKLVRASIAVALTIGSIGIGHAQTTPGFAEDGTVRVPAFELPVSEFMSEEAKAFQRLRARAPAPVMTQQEPDIATRRKQVDGMMASRVALMQKLYPVDIVETRMGGVPVRTITPRGRKVDPDRVLINLHGGGFTLCWESCSLLESVPIAALGGYKIVSVNYRMAPEAKHPAGVEDAAAVYRDLLKSYKPQRIGVFGCSAGGALTAQLASWLPSHGLPQAGAVGIFGAGAVRMGAGDSAYVAAYIDGSFPAPRKDGPDITRGYFAGSDMADPILSPALHPDALAKFPATLLVTGTRAMDMSPAILTNSRLLKAGVESTLIVGEGMGHCYMYDPNLPESRDAFDATVGFFRKQLR